MKTTDRTLTAVSTFYTIPVTLSEPEGKGFKDSTRRGHICLVVKPPKIGSDRFRFAASFKSPFDLQNFDLGTRIAVGRLFSNRPGKSYVVKIPGVKTFKKSNYAKVFNTILKDLLDRRQVIYSRGEATTRSAVPDWLVAALNQDQKLKPIKFSAQHQEISLKLKPSKQGEGSKNPAKKTVRSSKKKDS